ncbi:hypothetical protein [Telluribacter humicola]|uniref:hypothetical protein n=1 Tax=Telluribacter humicola TaxID=1720261 RepID=UPI001A973469|nr:hypothetical protein [Telluribacter humicola]
MHTLILNLLFLLVAVTDPLDRTYCEKTLATDLQAILLADTPDSTAYKAITQYLLLMSFTEEKLEGKTYRQFWEEYQLWEIQDKARQAREEEQAALEAEAEQKRTEELAKVVDVQLRDITAQYSDSTVQVYYSISITNRSEQNVKSVIGFLHHSDSTGGSVIYIALTFTEPLLPRTTRSETITSTYTYNSHTDFTQDWAQLDKAKVVWKPDEVRY